METWTNPSTGTTMQVHNAYVCDPTLPCVIHRPSDHDMSDWYLHWRSDRGIFERICSHGVGHPDPDQFDYWRATNQQHQAVHGCDGCCMKSPSVVGWV